MPRSQQPCFEEAGGRRLPLGGVNRYLGVRGKQGRNKDQFQGVTPKKVHRTKLFGSAQEAAIAFAQLKEDLELRILEPPPKKSQPRPPPPPQQRSPRSARTSATFCGRLLLLLYRVWHVRC